nr:hypothetical protein [Tanacetum cinerariifolium]
MGYSIPRHTFHLWLVMRKSLKIEDKLSPGLEDIRMWFQTMAAKRTTNNIAVSNIVMWHVTSDLVVVQA